MLNFYERNIEIIPRNKYVNRTDCLFILYIPSLSPPPPPQKKRDVVCETVVFTKCYLQYYITQYRLFFLTHCTAMSTEMCTWNLCILRYANTLQKFLFRHWKHILENKLMFICLCFLECVQFLSKGITYVSTLTIEKHRKGSN